MFFSFFAVFVLFFLYTFLPYFFSPPSPGKINFRIDKRFIHTRDSNRESHFFKTDTDFILDETEKRIGLGNSGSTRTRRNAWKRKFACNRANSSSPPVNQKSCADFVSTSVFPPPPESRQFPRTIYHSISDLVFSFFLFPTRRGREIVLGGIFRRNPRPRSIDPPDTGHLYLWRIGGGCNIIQPR